MSALVAESGKCFSKSNSIWDQDLKFRLYFYRNLQSDKHRFYCLILSMDFSSTRYLHHSYELHTSYALASAWIMYASFHTCLYLPVVYGLSFLKKSTKIPCLSVINLPHFFYQRPFSMQVVCPTKYLNSPCPSFCHPYQHRATSFW